jgi:flagellar biosynthesis protein FlhB
MSRDQDLDRSQQATPYKLEEARKRGQVARSPDAATLAILAAAVLLAFAALMPALRGLAALLAKGLAAMPTLTGDPAGAARFLAGPLREAVGVLAPLLFAVVVCAVLAGLLQGGGLIFSTTPLKPDFTRLNPVQGFKKLFSVRLLYEAAKNTLKLLALIGVTWLALQALVPSALHLLGLPGKALLFRLADTVGGLMTKLCAVLFAFMLVDLLFARWDFLRNLKMSRREVEDEHKNREGDPRIRARQREIRLQFLKAARAVSKVPGAQVVVTNPTHVAVALRYEPASRRLRSSWPRARACWRGRSAVPRTRPACPLCTARAWRARCTRKWPRTPTCPRPGTRRWRASSCGCAACARPDR